MKLPPMKKTYGGRTVLDLDALTLKSGRIHAVIGANGSGKSTLAKLLASAEQADGKAVPSSGLTVGYLPQRPYAFRMSVRRNLLLGGRDEERMRALAEALDIVPLLDKPARKLSGGETARMALARLYLNDYDLLILDEPTASTDRAATIRCEDLIRSEQRRTGNTVLLITHSLGEARRIADEVLFLCDGRCVEAGDAKKLLTAPDTEELKAFLRFYEG